MLKQIFVKQNKYFFQKNENLFSDWFNPFPITSIINFDLKYIDCGDSFSFFGKEI